MKNESLHLAPELQVRLRVLAAKSGRTLEELAENILRAHADEQERVVAERQEDEQRWQRYLETGQTISLDSVRGKLHTLAGQSATKAELQ